MTFPEMTWNDASRGAFLGMVKAIFPVLIVLGLVSFNEVEIAIIVVGIEAMVGFLATIFKQGQQAGPDVAEKMQRENQFHRANLEVLPDNVLALLRPVGWEGKTREELIDLLAGQ